MGVSIEIAHRWEQNHEYQIPEGCSLPPAFREAVDHHFATARTKDWDARVKEYWGLREPKVQDAMRYGKHQWDDLSPARTEVEPAVKLDTVSLHRPEEAEERSPSVFYQLRSTVEMCKRLRHDDFHGFMCLPSEIRELIYSHALLKGRVIVPNSGSASRDPGPVRHYMSDHGLHYTRYRGLEQELLAVGDGRRRAGAGPLGLVQGVSRAVHDEAARVYFGGNQFIFPAGRFTRPAYCNLLDTPGRSTGADFCRDARGRTNNAPLLRDVSYAFDMRDHPGDDHANLHRSPGIKASVDERALPPGEALRALHDQKTLDLEVDWAERADCIKRMTLDRLLLAFEECYCAIGCCRKVEWVLDRLLHRGPPPGTADTEDNAYSSIGWVSRPPLVVEVMGLVNDEEEVMAREKLSRLPGSEVRLARTTVGGALDELADGRVGSEEHLSQRLLLD